MPQSVPSLPRRVARMLRTSLFAQVGVALVLGIVVGRLWPDTATTFQPLGDGFIRLIKTVISPLVFCVVVVGIAKAGNLRAFGRIGLKALIWFEVASTAALLIGLIAANLVGPGSGMNVDPSKLDASAVDAKTAGGDLPTTGEFILNALPQSAIGAFAENSLLQVLVLACLVGAALLHLGHTKVPKILPAVEQAQEVIFAIVGFVMKLAPLAVFGAMVHLVGEYGLGVMKTYAKLIVLCYAVALVFLALLGVALKLMTGLSLWKFVRYTRAEMLLALGTASSESVMPRMMQKLRQAGARDDAVGLVLPTGYSFNLDGASIYLSIGTLFIAQAVGVDLSLSQQITVVLVLMLTSKGMAGIPGSAFLALSATASSLGAIPAGAVALLLGVDRIMDSMRVVTNLLGNCVAVFAVSKWEGALDTDRAKRMLDGELQFVEEDDDPAADATANAPARPLSEAAETPAAAHAEGADAPVRAGAPALTKTEAREPAPEVS
ncbi:cation:dicarboxylase symporter family transporter [Streptomyces scabiei]|uniref:cation:dicarboxylate symporter family transporter n=1 Tax=Streptomyces scabiei TaxID=1930 RepID=UPI001B31408D|nr:MULTISPECIES: cation:dicarboxylase symporter family transporter [Streptomyces]MBP5865309.1 cation:dicarboxylase symporter family transporter [Streptomyces sp. LBUM 1484]MBP5874003.1 cation:dicarboxylase symporter family transporter [Streptomyces sp. LBUM 1477]MBP5881720.1 cation:dicarboxylase symporter family transporter [Streptomyces sp. LBUM 1487]MBP5897494.1 cation:dicarboxylase symporter family transporter [Streptomyces sp. LBUM 1488]MDW8471154.1 cation:dicarboxylase symporter family tr